MDELFARFPHIAMQIFEQLDNKSLTNCREVANSWQKFIDERNMSWIRIVDLPRTLLSDRYMHGHYVHGNEYRTHDNTYLHLAAKTGQRVIFEINGLLAAILCI